MNPDLAALLAGLRDDPADEVAAVALADWCLEQSDPATQARGEHVRMSLRLGKLGSGDAGARELRRQVRALEKRHRAAWLGTMRPLAHRCDFLPGGLVRLQLSSGMLRQARSLALPAPSAESFAWVSQIE